MHAINSPVKKRHGESSDSDYLSPKPAGISDIGGSYGGIIAR